MIGHILLTALVISVVDSTSVHWNHLSKDAELRHSSGQDVDDKHVGGRTMFVGERNNSVAPRWSFDWFW
ncbi:unnamed protein product [Trichobilharzia szidati]|nr:unnamed protein product [Trichobilharzia szidati]